MHLSSPKKTAEIGRTLDILMFNYLVVVVLKCFGAQNFYLEICNVNLCAFALVDVNFSSRLCWSCYSAIVFEEIGSVIGMATAEEEDQSPISEVYELFYAFCANGKETNGLIVEKRINFHECFAI